LYATTIECLIEFVSLQCKYDLEILFEQIFFMKSYSNLFLEGFWRVSNMPRISI